MKTAISIPDAIFNKAEAFAKRRGITRSELYATAVSTFVKQADQQDVTERLNAVYGGDDDGRLDAVMRRVARKTLRRDP